MWLLKTEPSEFGYDDLEKSKKSVWDGVRNPVARKNLGAMKEGELAFVYHTGDEKAVVGVARVCREAYQDPKSKDPRSVVVDVEPVRRLGTPVPLSSLKALSVFATSPLVRQGRLSVVPITKAQWEAIESRGKA